MSITQLIKLLQTGTKERIPPFLQGFFSGSELILRSTRLFATTFENWSSIHYCWFAFSQHSLLPHHTNTSPEMYENPRTQQTLTYMIYWLADLWLWFILEVWSLRPEKRNWSTSLQKNGNCFELQTLQEHTCHLKPKQTGLVGLQAVLHTSSQWAVPHLNEWGLAALVMHNLFCFHEVSSVSFWINTCVGKDLVNQLRTGTVYQQKASPWSLPTEIPQSCLKALNRTRLWRSLTWSVPNLPWKQHTCA